MSIWNLDIKFTLSQTDSYHIFSGGGGGGGGGGGEGCFDPSNAVISFIFRVLVARD